MLYQEAKRNLLGDFESPLDFIHGFDASCAIGGSHVDRRSAGAPELVVPKQGSVHGVQGNPAGAKPVGDLAHVMLAVGVVEMLAGGEDLDGLGPAAFETVQQAGV